MRRFAAAVLVSLSLVSVGTGSAQAEDSHKTWWKYLEGEWSYEIAPLGIKGNVTWRRTAKGSALTGRFVEEGGVTSVEFGGWRSDTKSLVSSGYGSKGNYWHLNLPEVTDDQIKGHNHGVLPDGRSYKGEFVGKRVDDNTYEFQFAGKTGGGEPLKMTGKFARKQPSSPVTPAKKKWLTFFVGDWSRKTKVWTKAKGWVETTSEWTGNLAAGGNALVSRGKDSEGVEFVGMDVIDEGGFIETGAESKGGSWLIRFNKVTDESLEGGITGVLPDGSKGAGKLTIKRTGPKSYTTTWQVRLPDGVMKGVEENTK